MMTPTVRPYVSHPLPPLTGGVESGTAAGALLWWLA